jgi:hypothetical protein
MYAAMLGLCVHLLQVCQENSISLEAALGSYRGRIVESL